jgi:hypothetical protein
MNESDPRDPRLDAAYRDAATDEPPAAIDERLRAAARRAVAAGPQSLEARARGEAQRSWAARWRVPVSIAATVVVAVTLSYMVEREDAQLARVDGHPGTAPPQAVAVAPSEGANAPVPAAAPTPDLAQAERAAKSANRLERETAERPPPIPAPGGADGPTTNGMLAKEAERRQAASDTAPPASPPPQTRIAPAETQTAPAAATSVPPPAPAPMARPAPARDLAEPSGRDRAFADRPGRMERGAAAVSAEQKPRTLEEWLGELRRLKAAGRTDELAKELAEFRKRFPDYKLPADLSP